MIKFTEKNHKYTNKNVRYKSVSKVISQFKQPFNQGYWSSYKVLQQMVPAKTFYYWKNKLGKTFILHLLSMVDREEFDILKKELIGQWRAKSNKSCKRGTKFHNAKEASSYETGTEFNLKDKKTYKVHSKIIKPNINESLADDLYELEDGYYPELLLWNHDYHLAGQADRVFITTIDGIRYFDIGDYKTNEKIKTSNKFQSMKSPIGHLEDCNYNHYRLQLSCYAWMMTQFGFTCRHLSFDHYKEGIGEPVRYEFDFLKDEVEAILPLACLKHPVST